MDQTAKHEAMAFFYFLNRATVPLLQLRPDGQRELFGTGTLFEVGETLFLVTAGHFMEQMAAGGNIAVAEADQIRYVPASFPVWRSVETEPYDVGLIDLTSQRHGFSPYSPLGPEHVLLKTRSVSDVVFVAGFPVEKADTTREFLQHPHVFPTAHYQGDPNPPGAGSSFDDDHHLLLDFPKEALQFSEDHWRKREVSSCEGVSGGPVWILLPRGESSEEVWTGERAAKLYGIQSSQLKGRFLRATLWGTIVGCILTWRPELEPCFDGHL